jgi:hypothetical protein
MVELRLSCFVAFSCVNLLFIGDLAVASHSDLAGDAKCSNNDEERS